MTHDLKPVKILSFALLALLAMLSPVLAASEVELKAQAINFTLAQVIELEEAPLLDNFISNDSMEYVIAYIDRNPAFLLNLVKEGGNYSAIIVDDNQRIADVIQRRYEQQMGELGEGKQLGGQLHGYIARFNESRFFGEAKYNLLLGLEGSACTGIEQCRGYCNASEVCAYAYAKDGDNLLYGMITYSAGRENLQRIVEAESELFAASPQKTDMQIIEAYQEIIQQLENEAEQVKNSSMLKNSSTIYSGEIGYDEAALSDAMGRIAMALTPAQIKQSKDDMIMQIQQITALHAPKLAEPEIEEAQNETVEIFPIIKEGVGVQEINEEVGVLVEENVSAPLVPIKEKGGNGTDEFVKNVVFVFVALLIIAAGIALLKIGKGGKKAGLAPQGGKQNKKQVYSLEDLV